MFSTFSEIIQISCLSLNTILQCNSSVQKTATPFKAASTQQPVGNPSNAPGYNLKGKFGESIISIEE